MLSTFGLGPLILFSLSVVLLALILLVEYAYLMEVGSPCFITGITVFASIPAIRLPSYMTWAFSVFGFAVSEDATLSCVRS